MADTPAYRVNLRTAILDAIQFKKATRTLKGEEHTPPRVTLVISVDLETIQPVLSDLATVYRYGGTLGERDGPGLGLTFPPKAEQRKLWEQATTAIESAPVKPAGAGGEPGNVTPIGGRPRTESATT